MKETIIRIFNQFNNANIQYVLLRGYSPVQEIFISKDIDVFISKHSLKQASQILMEYGFKTPKINACNYPHIQFFKLTSTGLIKWDIVTDLCFGQELLTYAQANKLFAQAYQEAFFKILPDAIALELLLLHVLLDKQTLSAQNRMRIINLVNRTNGCCLEKLPAFLHQFCHACMDAAPLEKQTLQVAISQAHNYKQLIKTPNATMLQWQTRFFSKWRYRLHRLHRKSIAFIGVDGSGKSTTIGILQRILGSGCYVQYMGFREMETKWGREWYASNRPFKLKFLPFVGIYLEMWYRYLKYRFSNGRLILLDRFPWEAYDNGFGKYKVVYFVLFKLLFPKPYRVYYFHCAVSTSLKRKDDIVDINLFSAMKNRFDCKYKNRSLAFDTDALAPDQIIQQICQDIMASNLYEYLF